MRRILPILLMAVGFALSVALPAGASIPQGRLGVGDSIMLSSRDELAGYETPVNAKVGRQFDEGLRVIRWRANHGTLPKRVIVHLGTNGWIDATACDTLVDEVGPSRRVFLVTVRVPRDWMHDDNERIRACAASYDRVHVIRWAMVSGRHPEWFSDDGYHLNAEGQSAYAAYLDARIDAIMASVRLGQPAT
jgi:lysophospholipase L1-like esterase